MKSKKELEEHRKMTRYLFMKFVGENPYHSDQKLAVFMQAAVEMSNYFQVLYEGYPDDFEKSSKDTVQERAEELL